MNLDKLREVAKEKGYAPFLNIGHITYSRIEEKCGKWVLQFMEKGLDDPERIYPKWAWIFSLSMCDIGKTECERFLESGNLYEFVTSSPHFIKRDSNRWKRNVFKRRMKSPGQTSDRLERTSSLPS